MSTKPEITIIHFNDVYNIEPQNEEPKGGAARMASYIKSCHDLNPVILSSGDLLNPSLSKCSFFWVHIPTFESSASILV